MIGNQIFGNFVLMEKEEIDSIKDGDIDENPIVLSIYDTENCGEERKDFHFDHSDFEDAEVKK